jgi:Ca-activated chloride channel homolog
VTNETDLVRLVEDRARAGTFLTVLGFGMGKFRDATLENLANKGRGHYGYIDSRREADYILGEQINGTLMTIAKDVKIQVQFNPRTVASYRLIGFEDRMPAGKYFKSDRIDAGEVGVGHTLTALYEIVPADDGDYAIDFLSEVDDLKYQEKPVKAKKANLTPTVEAELLTVYVRYKEPAADESRQLEFALTDPGARFDAASPDFKFAAAVAQFGMQLRKSPHKGVATIDNIVDWATPGAESPDDDPGGLRREFIDLARRAESLMP